MKEELNKLEQERKELNTLINKGVSFEIKDIEFETHKRFFGLIKKRVPKEVTRTFTIEETTLSTLDRLSSEWIEFAIDEALMKSTDGMKKARGLAKEHAIRCARIVAIAVLGENRLIPRSHKGGTRWVEDVQAIEDLTALFARKIKPSRLYQLCVLVNAMCNLGDFFELYSIDAAGKNHNAESDRGKQRGLNSPHGRRGAICEHFGWTYDYLLHGIAWSIVQRMMIDAPSYDFGDDNEVQEIKLTEDNNQQIMNFVNSMM